MPSVSGADSAAALMLSREQKRTTVSKSATVFFMGATTGTTALSGDEFSLQGTFGTVIIHNVSIELDKGVKIAGSLIADHASIAVSNGAVIGSRDSGLASCSITGGSLTVVNSSVFAEITGISGAELHLDADTNAKSFAGVKGEFDQITGRVYTCGDLTLNGTKDGSIAAFDDAGTGKTFGQDCVFLTGGMSYYSDSGMTGGAVAKNPEADTWIDVPIYGVWLTDPTATFTLSAGSVVGGTDALFQEAGSVWISGGSLDTKISGVNEPVVYTKGSMHCQMPHLSCPV